MLSIKKMKKGFWVRSIFSICSAAITGRPTCHAVAVWSKSGGQVRGYLDRTTHADMPSAVLFVQMAVNPPIGQAGNYADA